jgi:hypothetical protein
MQEYSVGFRGQKNDANFVQTHHELCNFSNIPLKSEGSNTEDSVATGIDIFKTIQFIDDHQSHY